jgi:hypothetical protein
MQAWQQVKVSNPESQYVGEAGVVQTVETKGKKELVTVKLDNFDDHQVFDATELQILC